MTCQDARENAAADLLTGQPLTPEIDEHVSTCSECRREVEQLRSVVALLELAPPSSTTESPGDLLLHRTLARATKERKRRRALVVIAAAAAALILVPGVAWRLSGDTSDGGQTQVATALRAVASDPDTGVSGTAQVRPSVTGSELTVEVKGVQSGTKCTLVVVDRNGARSVADSWTADYYGAASVTTQTSVPVAQISHLELVDASADNPLLHFNFA